MTDMCEQFYIYRGHSSIFGINEKKYEPDNIHKENIIQDFTFNIPNGYTFITFHEIGEFSYSNITSKYIFESINEMGYEKFKEQILNIIELNKSNTETINAEINNLKAKMIKLYLIKLYREYKEPSFGKIINFVNDLFLEMKKIISSIIGQPTTQSNTQLNIQLNNQLNNQLNDKITEQITKLTEIRFNSIKEYIQLLNEIKLYIKSTKSTNLSQFEIQLQLCEFINKINYLQLQFKDQIELSAKNHFINYFNIAFNNIEVVTMIYDKKKAYSLTIQQMKAWTNLTSATFTWIDSVLVDNIIKALNFNINIFKSGSKMYKLYSNMELSHINPKTNIRTVYYNGFWKLNEYLSFNNYSFDVPANYDLSCITNRQKFRSNLYTHLINNDNIFLDKMLLLSDENKIKLAEFCSELKLNLNKIIDSDEYNFIIEKYDFINGLVNGFNFTGKTYEKLLKHIEPYIDKLNPGIYIFNTCGNIINNHPIITETKDKIVSTLNSIKFNK